MVDVNSTDTLKAVPADKQQATVAIKDKALYDKTFIDGLADYNEPIKLIDNFILVGKDTMYFPSDLQLNQKTFFHGNKDGRSFVLTVTRTNMTSLIYTFQLSDKNNKAIENKSGQAILGSLFFLAAEGDNDTEMGSGYGSYEYWDKSNDCWFSVRIGIGLDDNGKRRAKLNNGCEDKNKPTLTLDDCPTLRTE